MKKALSEHAVWFYFLTALLLLAIFVWFQQAATDNSYFLLLMFSSFIFLCAGNFLMLRAFVRFFENRKRLCSTVAVFFIAATLFVSYSLIQVPRGGVWNRVYARPKEMIMLSIPNQGGGRYYGVYSEILYSAKYPVSYLNASSMFNHRSLMLYVENPPKMHGTLDISLFFRPYELNTSPAFQEPIVFNESSGSIYQIPIEVDISVARGAVDPGSRVRFEGYNLELTLSLSFSGPEKGASGLIFGFNMTNLTILVDDFIVDSNFQNGSCISMSGIFIGVDAYIVGKFVVASQLKKARR